MPSTKVTAAAITAAVVTIIVAVATSVFDVEVSEELAAGITGIVSLIVAYFVPETNPAPSSIPYLPPEVRGQLPLP
jgi:hypothetical protein